ncbi:helix-turn-helix transcriptional regulator [Roseomonas eburnea]|uniref:Helix-turn-helix transcriptional regulator n=1 Tax=Neoroseomonas eburnea TaxID=1346889 RepID=A0A9X9X5U4_9PROT|nr:helix-turn-helix domain-containing protein [Neoroseomonas eburnea]MBR0679080.1 helix-turn-helix transcriptional regulator [Neoroseomonas eburnea]
MPAPRTVNHDCPIRDVLDRVGDAWSVLVIAELDKAPCRFNALRRVIDGVSQRMLAVTLRQLERDGLVTRRVTDGRPPQVTYALTPRGVSLHAALAPLADWAARHQQAIRESRAAFEAAQAAAA